MNLELEVLDDMEAPITTSQGIGACLLAAAAGIGLGMLFVAT